MGDHAEVVAAVHQLLKKLNADPLLESHRILRILQKLDRLPITVKVLQETGVGKAVNKLRRRGGEITDAVKHLVQSWKELVREAMEAEERPQSSPERNPSPSPQSATSEEEEDDEDSSDEDDSSSDGSSESDVESERDKRHYSPEPSPTYESPPPTPRKHPSNRHGSKERNERVSLSKEERVSSKRHHESSPSRYQDASDTHLCSSSSHIKKRKIEERPVSEFKESSKVMKKKPPEDDSFSQALFPSPRKIGSSPSPLTKSPVQKQKERDKTNFATKQATCRSGNLNQKAPSSGIEKGSDRIVSKSPQKKVVQKNDQERTNSKNSESSALNGSVREPKTSFLDMVDDVDVSKQKSVKLNKTQSSKSSPTSKSSSSSSASSSSQKKPGSASLAVSSDRDSKSSKTADKISKGEHDRMGSKSSKESKPSSEKTSKSSSGNNSVKLTKHSESDSNAEETPAPKAKRKLSSGERRISVGDQSFDNTGLSFGDILMGPALSTKVKKPVKRMNTSSSNATKKSLSSSKSSSSSSTSKSTSSRAGDSSSSKHTTQKTSKSPSSSGKGNKKVESKDGGKSKGERLKIPRSLSPKLEDIHQKITFNLPEISADYKPLRLPELSSKKKVGGVNEEGSYIGSKHQRTKLYSGRARQTLSTVPSLFEACMRILLDNIDSLYEIGVPYDIIRPVLEKCTPKQLLHLEEYNPYLIEDTNDLWRLHAEKDFRKFKPEEMESWRELYLRKMDEREEKLKNLTANIKGSMAKKDPGRLTKMAFVIGPAKPPRNVQRQQARHGTGRITSQPASNPHKPYVPSKHAGDTGPIRSSSTSTIKSGDHLRSSHSEEGGGGGSSRGGGGDGGGSQNYGSISMSNANGGSSRGGRGKAAKAPMMQKALRMKKLFRR